MCRPEKQRVKHGEVRHLGAVRRLPWGGRTDRSTREPLPAELAPLIADLTFEVDRPSYVGKCPVGLQFTGSITTSRAGYIQYRSITDDGTTSPTETLEFADAGTQKISISSETIEPAAQDDGPSYEGWRRLEIIEPAGLAPSSTADFSVTCQE